MSNLICKDCKSTDVTAYTPGIFGDSRHRCNSCGKISATADFVVPTLFDRITASVEALAPRLVFCAEYKTIRPMYLEGKGGIIVGEVWKSTVIDGTSFKTEAEAIAATLEKLKEVKR